MGNLVSSKQESPPPLPRVISSSRWELRARPNGLVSVDDFALQEQIEIDTDLDEGEALVQVEMLSVDAFLRTMLDEKAYHGAISLGDTLPALGYGRVIASASPKLRPGSRVMGMLGACTVAKLSAEQAAMLMPMISLPGVPPTAFLGILGITSGITAWVGVHAVARPPRRGETALVSGATGATGSVAAQLAKVAGARTIGVAGGPAKAAYCTSALGLAGCVDYKAERPAGEQLDELCPDGIDFYFDTVGGPLLDEALKRLNRGGRVVICGASSQYNGNLNVGTVRGPSEYLKLAERGASMVGYNVLFYMHKLPFAILHLLWLRWRRKVALAEQVERGIGGFGPAMVKMFTGGHIGKLLVEVAEGGEAAVSAVGATPTQAKAVKLA